MMKRTDRMLGASSWWKRGCMLSVLTAVLFMLLVTVFPIKAAAEENVKLSKTTITLYQTRTKRLKLKNAEGQISWTSTNPAVASVDQSGKVSAIGAGSCRIKAICGDVTRICKVKVKGIQLSEQDVTIVRGRQVQLKTNYSKASKGTWKSSNTSVASVDPTGCVQTKQPGKTVISLFWNGIRLTCNIKVVKISMDNLASTYAANKSNRGKIILAGSSSMDFWNSAPQAFAPYEVINTAIGGTTVTQWLTWYKKLITRYRPQSRRAVPKSSQAVTGSSISHQAKTMVARGFR